MYPCSLPSGLPQAATGTRRLVKAGIGRPTDKPARGHRRRRMHHELAGSQRGRPYAQRAQAETAISMLMRNLGDDRKSRDGRGRSGRCC